MSKWTDIRDNIVRELHIDNVTEEIKQRVSASIVSEVLPPIEDAVNKFVATIQGAVWLVKMVLTKTLPTEQA